MTSAPVWRDGDTIATARRALAHSFRRAGIDSPEGDARILVGHALALDHAALASAADSMLSGAQAERIAVLAARRLGREPVARILGRKEFWGLDLAISPDVLVPRPDTETVIEAALAAIAPRGPGEPLRVADLGVGSGALMLALLSELPRAIAVGTDRHRAAIALARRNAERLGFADRALFIACDFAAALGGGFDLVVANPPYIPTAEIARLAPEVREFDPRVALDGGTDGLAAYRAIAAEGSRVLAPGGTLVVEVGRGQADDVAAIFAAAGLEPEQAARADLAGIPRAVSARRSP